MIGLFEHSNHATLIQISKHFKKGFEGTFIFRKSSLALNPVRDVLNFVKVKSWHADFHSMIPNGDHRTRLIILKR